MAECAVGDGLAGYAPSIRGTQKPSPPETVFDNFATPLHLSFAAAVRPRRLVGSLVGELLVAAPSCRGFVLLAEGNIGAARLGQPAQVRAISSSSSVSQQPLALDRPIQF